MYCIFVFLQIESKKNVLLEKLKDERGKSLRNEKGKFTVDIHKIDGKEGDINLEVISDWNEFVKNRMSESFYVTMSNFVSQKLKYLQDKHDDELQRINNETTNLKKDDYTQTMTETPKERRENNQSMNIDKINHKNKNSEIFKIYKIFNTKLATIQTVVKQQDPALVTLGDERISFEEMRFIYNHKHKQLII